MLAKLELLFLSDTIINLNFRRVIRLTVPRGVMTVAVAAYVVGL